MKILTSHEYAEKRATTARKAARENIDLDSARSGATTGRTPADSQEPPWQFAPRQQAWDGLCRVPSLETFLSGTELRPGFDLVAYLANRSRDAYLKHDPELERIGFPAWIEKQGGAHGLWFKKWTDAAVVYRRGNAVVVSFRGSGSNPLQWIFTNVNALPAFWPWSGWHVRHLGFLLAWKRLRPQLLRWLDQHFPPGGHLLITGHSLGGAIALLAAYELSDRYPVRAVVTIGAPRVGWHLFQTAYAEKPCWKDGNTVLARLGDVTQRINHDDDLVSRIPPPPLFRHIGDALRLDNTGTLTRGESATTLTRSAARIDRWIDRAYVKLFELRTRPQLKPSVFGQPHVVPTGQVTQVHPMLRQGLAVTQPHRGVTRVLDDSQTLLAKWPLLHYVWSYVLLAGLGVVSVAFAIGVFLLALVDFRAHNSDLYVNAFRRRYDAAKE